MIIGSETHVPAVGQVTENGDGVGYRRGVGRKHRQWLRRSWLSGRYRQRYRH